MTDLIIVTKSLEIKEASKKVYGPDGPQSAIFVAGFGRNGVTKAEATAAAKKAIKQHLREEKEYGK